MSETRQEIVKVSCIRHLYPDRTEVHICGLEFVVHASERVVILGSNGSGKTTLLNHLLGLLKPIEGMVKVFGVDPYQHFDQIRERIGVVFQNVDAQLVAPTVWEDVTFGPSNFKYPADKIDELGHDILDRIGILNLKNKITHYLSGGEKKKVALAGAMITHPKLLIMDEPFEGLDPRSKEDIADIINMFNKDYGTSVIITTHDVNLVPHIADRAYVMEKGNLELSGKPQDIFTKVDFIRSINLEPPIISEVIQALRSKGIDLEYTNDVDKLIEELSQILQSDR